MKRQTLCSSGVFVRVKYTYIQCLPYIEIYPHNIDRRTLLVVISNKAIAGDGNLKTKKRLDHR